MLHIYGTVYNNADMVRHSLISLEKINVPKRFYIVDNFSTDSTYEILNDLNNIQLLRLKCSRGKGRQLAMNMAFESSADQDFFMTIDLDTIYNETFAHSIEWAMENIGEGEVFINFLCKKRTNFAVPWRDLNNGEDWERAAHFYYLGYRCLSLPENLLRTLNINQVVDKHRELRYSKGIRFYLRLLKNTIDLIRGWGIDRKSKVKQYFDFVRPKISKKKYNQVKIIFMIIYFYCIAFEEIYSYGDLINRLLIQYDIVTPTFST